MVSNRTLRTLILALVSLCFFFVLESCRNKKSKDGLEKDTPISGQITIVADESFAPLLKNEATTFSEIYDRAKIKILFLPEMDVVDKFFKNEEYRLMVISRRLSTDEKKYFTALGLPSHEIKIAIDAIAFVVNLHNPDSNLRYNEVVDILSGKISSWSEINKDSKLGTPVVVFDNQRSSTVRFIREAVLKGKPLTQNAFAVDSNQALMDYVENNPSAIGVIGISWISDPEDSTADKFLKRINVVAVSSPDSLNAFYLPVKRFIYSMQYPFLRELFIVSQEKHAGLGTGFATYVASDEGQRIVQRSGLMAIDNAVRIIELKDQF